MKMKSEMFHQNQTVTPEFFRDLIEMAMEKTPTGGNSKPFIWHWEGSRLHVTHDQKLAEHYLNRNHNASKISLGCLIASVEIAAQSQGYQAHVKLGEQLSAEITFSTFSEGSLNKHILKRLYQRRTYRGALASSLPPNIEMLDEDGIHVRLASAASLTQEFKKYLIQSDLYLWLQKKAMNSFFAEIRFFDDRLAPRGIRSKDLGVGLHDQFLLYFFSFMPWLLNLFIRIPVLNYNFMQSAKRSQKNAHFVLVTADGSDTLSVVRAGRVAMKTWLELEEQGYQVQPASIASLTLVAASTGHLPEDTLPRYRSLFEKEGPVLMKSQFQLAPNENPVWMLRVGKAKN